MSGFIMFSNFSDAEIYWNSRPKSPFRDVKRIINFDGGADTFLMNLAALYDATGERCIQETIDVIKSRKIIVNGTWDASIRKHYTEDMEKGSGERAAKLVALLVGSKISLRLATAIVAANFQWPANSFSAAVKSIERSYRSYFAA